MVQGGKKVYIYRDTERWYKCAKILTENLGEGDIEVPCNCSRNVPGSLRLFQKKSLVNEPNIPQMDFTRFCQQVANKCMAPDSQLFLTS